VDHRRLVSRFGLTLSIAMTAMGLWGTVAGAAPESGWAIQPSPNPPGATFASLASVSCANDGTCMAVGSYGSGGGGTQPLAEYFDGSAWALLMPQAVGETAELTGVSCPAPQLCMAVGLSISGATVMPLVEQSNGTTWRVVHTPRPPNTFSASLASISCTSGDCIAVGGLLPNGVDAQEQPLAERWDGSAWSLVKAADPHAENGSSLEAVTCNRPGHCEAVGSYVFGDVVQFVFAEGWNGSTWRLQSQPNPGGEGTNTEDGVGCLSDSLCHSVGSWVDNQGRTQTLAEGWNGTSWFREAPANPTGFEIAELLGVSCGSPVCEAVGDWSTSAFGFPSSTLAEQWSSGVWTIQPTPNPAGASESSLRAIDCRSGTDCVAVGSSLTGGIVQTLVETYSG